MKHYLSHLANESGVALVTGLVIMVLLTAIGTYAIHLTEIDNTLSGNLKASKQAFYLAEAGLQHAKIFLNQNKSNWNTYAYTTPQTLLAATSLAGIGQYTVTIQDAGGGGRRVRSTGTTTSQANAVVENLVRLGPYTPGTAVTVGGPLAISGNPTIAGANGGVHANGNLSLSGNPTISSNATASGTYSASGNPAIGGIAAGGQPLVTIPTINPAQFFDSRDFRLASDGNVYNKDGVVQPKSGGKWNGWDYSSGKWSLSGNTTINATLYIEGDGVISGNIGSTANPWVTTIIATKSIEVSGNPKMRPPTTTDAGSLYRSGTENLLLVAGGDVKISGNPNQSYQGIIAAHEQLSLSGNPTLNGFIVVENAANSGGSYADNNTISGNIGITYNGSLDNPFPGDVQVMTWQLGS